MVNKRSLEYISISENATMLETIKKMDAVVRKLLIVLSDEGKFIGLVSIGDIQRAIIKEFEMGDPISSILRKDFMIARSYHNIDEIKEMMLGKRAEFIPVVDDNGVVKHIWFWEDFFEKRSHFSNELEDVAVVIMAGGKGTRLKPITNIIPKPLIPIGEKPIIEIIIEKFYAYGARSFNLSVNYKALMIKQYFEEDCKRSYNLNYVFEDEPLGTAGSLKLLKETINGTFIVSNCDIIIDDDYAEILNYHKESRNLLTAVAAIKSYSIPYGIMNIGENGLLESLEEKPEYSYLINAGMYILEPSLLEIIPSKQFFHITDLIDLIQTKGGRVGVYPVSSGSWMDIGEWKEYQSTLERFGERIVIK
ncbi:nucleotidyltransferase family protein [Arachidicoccus terrestris]|uniref:nucleotidyltransferase family protein n=1 Tax=Arachidicoccus terrestris TaxID=2875539 RepID=UPI001CC4BFCB|nr:nucleotidyltransferase family protein [Arachidicoccus terrestris]UAY55458.1 nucleotidyltransferase family protein [Arachidicoccus terrestris]